jgi:benzylsuccinate CoA-transferase BbsF subunit
MLENFAGGTINRIGLGYEVVKKLKPDIIMVSTCMLGQTGPYSNSQGTGVHLNALSGFYDITGWPDREPSGPSGPYPDYIASRLGAIAILSALNYRRRTGKGQYIDLSQLEGSVHFLSPLILDNYVNQRVAKRMGNRHDDAAPHGAYRCCGEDRWCAIAVFTDEEWQNFCKVIGNPAWTKDQKFSSLPSRKENEDELDKLVETWTINHSAEEIMTLMQTGNVGAGIVSNAEDMVEHNPQIKHRNLFQYPVHPEIGKYVVPGFSYIFSKMNTQLQTAPVLGEHNEYILRNILGMGDEEIAELVIAGVVE